MYVPVHNVALDWVQIHRCIVLEFSKPSLCFIFFIGRKLVLVHRIDFTGDALFFINHKCMTDRTLTRRIHKKMSRSVTVSLFTPWPHVIWYRIEDKEHGCLENMCVVSKRMNIIPLTTLDSSGNNKKENIFLLKPGSTRGGHYEKKNKKKNNNKTNQPLSLWLMLSLSDWQITICFYECFCESGFLAPFLNRPVTPKRWTTDRLYTEVVTRNYLRFRVNFGQSQSERKKPQGA